MGHGSVWWAVSTTSSRSGTGWRLAVLLAITAGCLGWVLWGLEPHAAIDALAEAQWQWVPVVIGAFVLNHVLRVWRFQTLLGAVPFGRVLSVCSVGFFAMTVIPLRLGELVRPYLLSLDGVPVGRSVAAVLVERLLDVGMLLALLLWVAWGLDLPASITVGGIDVVEAGQRAAGVTLLGGLGVAVVLGVAGERVAAKIPVVGAAITTLSAALTDLLRAPGRTALLVAQSVAIWAVTIGYVGCALRCFPDLPQGWTVATVVWAGIIAGMVALPTPGFFGSYEAFGLAALLLWGVDDQVGRTFALFLHLLNFGFTVAIGVGYLVAEGWSLRAVVQQSHAVTPEA